MLDIATLLQSCLNTHWAELNEELTPALADLIFQFDEFDPKNPSLQILLENLPDKKTWIINTLYKVEHQCRISISVIPTGGATTDDNIEAAKTLFINMKTEIDRILEGNKFSITGISDLAMKGGWNDGETLVRGLGTKNTTIGQYTLRGGTAGNGLPSEPVIFKSVQVFTAIYYDESGSL